MSRPRSRSALAFSPALALALTAFAACDRQPSASSSTAASASIEAAPAASPAPSASGPSLADVSARVLPQAIAPGPSGSARAGAAPGPAASGSQTAEERERALALLLTGNTRASELPEAATAPGLGFDASLRRQLTTVEIEAPGSSPSHSVVVRTGAVSLSGKLPVEVVKRIARQNLGRVRMCYEMGLRRNPMLQGRVTVKFVIGTDGSVQMATAGASDLADAQTVQCVVGAFRSLSFPTPESGIVTVTYPITLTPGS